MAMYLSDIFTIPSDLAGTPAISLPSGLDSKGLPIGLQLMGRHLDEATVLRAAYAFEQDLGLSAVPGIVEEAA
jgi:aspartyl-tRNA(Asn)/glutamyl-tRNA(Gln) amidotransferase subunit A